MRKPRRLPLEQLAPYEWVMPIRIPRWSRIEDSPLQLSQNPDSSVPTDHPASAKQRWDEAGPTTAVTRLPESMVYPLIDWSQLFGNEQPVEIEVGSGKGQFLVSSAQLRPDVNFFGIEVVRKYQLYTATRCAIRQLRNVRTTCADARWVLHYFIPAASVQAVHVYFPDPWWKARHKKRRLFTPGFVQDVARVLQPGGRLHIATDVEEYFDSMCTMISDSGVFEQLQRGPDESTPPELQTNFEKKARARGSRIWRAIYVKTRQESDVSVRST